MIREYALNIAIGYLLGSVPFGLIVGYFWLGEDIRRRGSGRTGTTNVLRTAGKVPAALVLLGDLSKGLAPAVLGNTLFDSAGVAAAGAAAALIGHVFPLFAGFRGGRGVATAFGGILGLMPLVAVVFPVIAAVILIRTRIVSLMSVIGTALAGTIIVVAVLLKLEPMAYAIYAVIAVATIELMHIPNIRRLIAGTEPRIGRGGDRPATG